MGQAALWGAVGGFIGGGISGGLQAHAQGLNIWTGKAPLPAPVPIPLSTPTTADDISIRGNPGSKIDLSQAKVSPTISPDHRLATPAFSQKLTQVEEISQALKEGIGLEDLQMLKNNFDFKYGSKPLNSLFAPVSEEGTLRSVSGTFTSHERFVRLIGGGNNVQIVVWQRLRGAADWQIIQNITVPSQVLRNYGINVPQNAIFQHNYGVKP